MAELLDHNWGRNSELGSVVASPWTLVRPQGANQANRYQRAPAINSQCSNCNESSKAFAIFTPGQRYSNATPPSGAFSSNHFSAASIEAKTLMWSSSPIYLAASV
ncbi:MULTISPECIES: hypothetical protein [Bradyrhizobium]|jgi:hypothetical protein|uniref:Uncharacterized protein n=1 Tax=Bradyrhizobium elkanii TaxID=29448 RepID=A0A8I1Y9H3_BRAEL|nr:MULTISPECIES: hypothetical protein [Bradyrhizobium]MBP1295682.1 hypothetical protein [Bradyrhizobium elkanii]MCP1933419.1 hypothetical protein [Bradyrhizobium elkanii]MCS3478572.1 hypothetical protein [Bradyrhizobium elkanii]MCS3585345.1 hypothetical protein [Bradyrhizobium elkanii]MCS3718920.1 hypothetical protein [Bradyrhizobium elkanii]